MQNITTRMLQHKLLLMLLCLFLGFSVSAQDVLLTQSFENGGSMPAGWAKTTVSGSDALGFVTASSYPPGFTPTDGSYMVRFDSYNTPSAVNRLYMTSYISTVGRNIATVEFSWLESIAYASSFDRVTVQWSPDGTTWFNSGTYDRPGAADAWVTIQDNLPAQALNQPSLRIGFLFTSEYGNDCYLDDVTVTAQGLAGPVTVQIGTGTSTVAHPFYSLYEDSRTQIIYTAAEILAAGGAPGDITSLGFDVSSANSMTLSGFNIDIQHTTASTLTGFINSGWTNVYSGAYTCFVGWNIFTFTTPFNWDGTSNIILNICFNNDDWSGSSYVRYTSATGLTWHRHVDGDVGCSLTAGAVSSSRPNLQMTIAPPPLPTGIVQGFITNAYGIPIPGATVVATNNYETFTTTSGPNGAYSMDAYVGEYTMYAVKEGYNEISVNNVFVYMGQTTYQNIALTQPSMAITPNPYNVTLNPNEYLTGAFNIMNNGNGPVDWEASIEFIENDKSHYPVYTSTAVYDVVDSPNRAPQGTVPYDPTGELNNPTKDPTDIANGYVAYPLGGLVESPCSFMLNNPGQVTNFGSAAADFISAADYVGDIWYGAIYGGSQFMTIDPVTGAYTILGSTGDFVGMSYNGQDETMYGLSYAGTLYTVNLANGQATSVGPTGTSGFIAFEIDNDGIGYAVNLTTDQLGTINLETGQWTVIGPVGFNASYAQDMSCDHSTNELYWAAYDAGTSQGKLLLVNKTNGSSQLIGTFPGGSEIDGFAIPGSAGGGWLTLGSESGTVNPFSNYSLPAYFSAEDTEAGEVYMATVTFTSDPNVGTIAIPVTMVIAGPPLTSPTDLTAVLTNPFTGQVNLSWSFQPTGDFINFVIKRDNQVVGYSTTTTFINLLPTYGIYEYTVQAVFGQGESLPAGPVEVEWPNPTLLLNPTSLYNEQYIASSENVMLRVSNIGEGTMSFSFPAFAALELVNSPDFTPNVPSTIEAVEVAKGEIDPTDGAGNRNLRGAGGPDGYGYTWIDSDEAGGPAYTWTDISATGTLITGFTDDNVLGPYNLGFNFPFYENFYSTVNVSSNGYLIFGSTSSAYTNQNIPSSTAPNNIIAWFWDDLTGGGTVHYQNVGDRWIIQFTNYPPLSGSGNITAQVHLFPNGNIRIYYNNIAAGLTINSATIGIENNTGTIATNINYNANYVHNSLAIAINYPIPSFITNVTPAVGQVPPGGYKDVAVEFTASAMYHPVGTYTDELEINTNDLAHESVMIPATMVVYMPSHFAGTVTDITTDEPLNGVIVTAGAFQTTTDDQGEYSLILDPGVYDVYFEKTGYQTLIIPDAAALVGQVVELDAQLREESYPPSFVYAEVNEDDTEVLVTWGDGSGPYEVIYDDGSAENMTAWALPGNMNAVKFTPASYPANVIGGRIYVGDGSFPNNNTGFIGVTFGAMVKDDDGPNGLPGTTLDSIQVVVLNYGWVTFTGLDAEIADGDFYLVMVQGSVSPNTAPIGIDQEMPIVYRSYSRNISAGMPWALSPYQDFMMRAIVYGNPSGDDAIAQSSTEVLIPSKQTGIIAMSAPQSAAGGVEGTGLYKAALDIQDNSRALTGYRVVRFSGFDPNNSPQSGTETTIVPDMDGNSYTDMAWENLPAGWYAYGVAAHYPDDYESEITVSNVVGHLIDGTITINVALTTGGSPAGALVTLTGHQYPYDVFTATVPEDGQVVFSPVYFGNYTLFASKVGFEDYGYDLYISGDMTIDIMLAEHKYKPRNLYVDPVTLIATWDEPLATAVMEDFEGATFPPAGWQSLSEGIGWFASTNGGSSAFAIPSHTKYAVSNDDANSGNNGCCDYLITPEMDWTNLDSYRMTFASYYTGAYSQSGYVELSTDAGETWTVIQTMEPASAWTEIEIDFTQYSGVNGLNSVWIAFHSDDNGTWASGWAIDDVVILSGGVPLQGYGVFLDGTLVGNTIEQTFTYTNLNYGQEYLAGVAALFSSGYSELDTYLFRSLYLIPPDSLMAVSPEMTDYVHLTWNEPVSSGGGTGGTLFEDFEAGILGEDWEIIQTNTNTSGHPTPAYWTVNNYVGTDFGPFGVYHAGLWWDSGHQDEWIITPEVNIGLETVLTFESTVWEGPTPFNDHYYVKVSTDGGETWTPVWEAALISGSGFNYYDHNYTVDLSEFAGESAKVAFHAVDSDGMGLYAIWFIDNISIANAEESIMFPASSLTHISKSDNTNRSNSDQITRDGNTTRNMYTDASFTGNRAPTVPGIQGYNVYRGDELIGYVDHPTTEYYDQNLDPGTYTYWVSAVYDLTPYGFPFQTGESMKEGPAEVEVIYGFELPFVEDFSTGVFETNDWTIDAANWHIIGQQGNPAPTAEFTYTPQQLDYALSLSSSWMIGKGYVDGKIFLDFDLKLNDNTATGDEQLLVEVYNGSAWENFATYTAEGDEDWETKHVDISGSAKGNVFRVRFTAKGLNSLDINEWQVDNVHIYRLCEAPTNLEATLPNPATHGDQILLTWEGPDIPQPVAEWIMWDDGVNYTGIGVGVDATWGAAVRFTPTQLAEYAGTKLTKIRFVAATQSTGSSFVLKVWTGANAANLVMSQPVSSFISGTWNEYTLTAPVTITGTTELWFGYEVTQAAADFPGGCDNGPAVNQFGNWANLEGTWETLVSLNPALNYNWNIQGFVETVDGVALPALPIADNTDYNANGTLSMSSITYENGAVAPETGSREFTGFNVYRDDELIANTTETEYLDTDPEISVLGQSYCYKVTAVYSDCESDFSNTACETVISIVDPEISAVSIYPNPSNSVVNIELTNDISQLVIYNIVGQVVNEMRITKEKTVQIDVSSYDAGAYLVKFITREGQSFARKIAVTK